MNANMKISKNNMYAILKVERRPLRNKIHQYWQKKNEFDIKEFK